MLFLVFEKEISMENIRVKTGRWCVRFENMNDAISFCVRNDIVILDIVDADIIQLEGGFLTRL